MEDFEKRFADLVALKPSIAFLLNPFEIDVINGGFTLLKCLLPDTGELELIDMQEDQGLQFKKCSSSFAVNFWNDI